MNRFAMSAVFLFAAMLLSGAAQAMEIRQFDKMADRDQAAYIGDLIVGAQKVLMDSGKPTLAAQVKHLFTTKDPGDADVIGMVEFERNLAIVRAHDASHPNERPSDVEDVMVLTLQPNHIALPDSFYDVNKDFRPKLPPKP